MRRAISDAAAGGSRRLRIAGVDAAALDVTIRFEGRPVACAASDTIAAALVAAGELGLRDTREGDRRGVFCGMGVCQECLVEVDGDAGRRACMTPRARRDGRAEAAGAAGRLGDRVPARSTASRANGRPTCWSSAAGPRAMAAAIAARRAGLDVVLTDERAKLGGQYFKQPAAAPPHVHPRELDAQFRGGRALAAAVEHAGVEVLGGVEVWGAFGPHDLRAVGPDATWTLRPRRLVLATGAYERALPVPGWTLPGVMTTGAAQALLRAHQVAPGARVLVAGHGPLNMQLAAELVRGGATVVALAELAAITDPRRARFLARMAVASPGLVRDGVAYRATLARARVPVLTRTAVVACEGDGAVNAAVLARIGPDGRPVGRRRRFDVDAVCLGYGFAPSDELVRGLAGGAGVWVAGDAAGIGGAKAAKAAGTLAGAAAARSLGAVPDAGAEAAAGAALRRARRFQDALWEVFAAPAILDELATEDTYVCRCEAVSRGTLEPLLAADDVGHIGALKRATRAGMGGCQGRYCSPVMAELAARRRGAAVDARSGFAPAAPLKPVRIADLIAGPDPDPHAPDAPRSVGSAPR